ncbi:NUDIX hydrolase [Microbacterium amylolyticum]|uniref:8-oxo-dGTP diphosphatase n=1 Tax=Microbacterium amylolyticum TaxID=936337 RepID=A0ABS4ZL70_9MICO|nr:NUDIX hydrolase [Microbacterium amylolyticum]MBP2437191.1 8-oxo-dGTP diphosphatase [Microbacterium amylolyticum]
MTGTLVSSLPDETTRSARHVFAAGGVVWRFVAGELRVLLVHRTKYRDFSFPKGKVEGTESLAETAVREIREETGIAGNLGPSLGTVQYRLPSGRDKTVHYWTVEAREDAVRMSTFRPGREIAGIEWATLAEARERLSYPVDGLILDEFEKVVAAGGLGTFPIVLMRHGHAESASKAGGVDADRKLTKRGETQAAGAVGSLVAFGVKGIHSSPATRCVQTMTPLAKTLGREIHRHKSLSQDRWQDGLTDPQLIVGQRVAKTKATIFCSHAPVLPLVMDALVLATGTVRTSHIGDATRLATAGFTVAHISRTNPGSGIIAIESHASRA